MIDLAGDFLDADGDRLTYVIAALTSPGLVSGHIAGSRLTLCFDPRVSGAVR